MRNNGSVEFETSFYDNGSAEYGTSFYESLVISQDAGM
jgi:hypothetical protein